MEEQELNHYRIQKAEFSPSTEYDFETQMADLRLDKEQLKEKKVLEIGSGEGSFSIGASKIGCEVFSIEPKLCNKGFRDIVVDNPDFQKRSVAGLAQQIPFKDSTFNFVISHFCIPTWIPVGKKEGFFDNEALAIIKEICRVLKGSGQGVFYPISGAQEVEKEDNAFEEYFGKKAKKWLQDNGYRYFFDRSGENQYSPALKIEKKSNE